MFGEMNLSLLRLVGSKSHELLAVFGTQVWLLGHRYIVQAFQWCRKYGIRVNLDLHTIPGSQNGTHPNSREEPDYIYIDGFLLGYNHSGKSGQINFLYGVMGMANAQRAMNYIRIITEFISQPEWRDVVPVFGIVNEALITTIGTDELRGLWVWLSVF